MDEKFVEKLDKMPKLVLVPLILTMKEGFRRIRDGKTNCPPDQAAATNIKFVEDIVNKFSEL